MQFLDALRGEDGGALVDLELVVDVEFFAEPDEAFGLRDLEVVDC